MHLLPRLLLLVGLLYASHASAQPGPGASPAEPTVSVQFMFYSWHGKLPELRYSPRQKTEALHDPFSSTGVYSYSGPATLHFYSASAKLTGDAEPPPPLASVTFPPGSTKFTLLAASAGGGRYRIYAIPQDDTALTPPYIRVHNFTNTALTLGFDEKSLVQIPAISATVIKPQGTATVIRVARYQDGRWRRLFNNVAELNEEGRQNIILAPDGARPVSMFTIPPWPKSPAPEPHTAAAN